MEGWILSVGLIICFLCILGIFEVKHQRTHNSNIQQMKNLSINHSFRVQSSSSKRDTRILFYIYDAPEFHFLKNCSRRFNYSQNIYGKHEDDILFLTRIYDHPLRTLNPTKAKVFIIPIILGSIFRFLSYTFPNQKSGNMLMQPGLCGNKTTMFRMMENAGKSILKSDFFIKNQGKDHLVVSSEFRAQSVHWYPKNFADVMKRINFGTFEEIFAPSLMNSQTVFTYGSSARNGATEKIHPRCSVITPYVNKIETNYKFDDWKNSSERKIDFLFMGQYNQKGSYRDRVRLNNIFHVGKDWLKTSPRIFADTVNYGLKMKHCEYENFKNANFSHKFKFTYPAPKLTNCYIEKAMKDDYLKLLSDSKFSLIISGDTASTSRLYDAIERGSIPIIVSDLLPMVSFPFKSKVPWERLVYFLSSHADERNILKSLYDIWSKKDDELNEKQKYLQKYGKEVLWWSKQGSNVVKNLIEETYFKCVL